jgi:hypothetical protein
MDSTSKKIVELTKTITESASEIREMMNRNEMIDGPVARLTVARVQEIERIAGNIHRSFVAQASKVPDGD